MRSHYDALARCTSNLNSSQVDKGHEHGDPANGLADRCKL